MSAIATSTRYDNSTLSLIWLFGSDEVPGSNDLDRIDRFGSLIRFSEYGNTSSQYGWEGDHIIPVARGGSEALSNLQPLQWENNRKKSDNHW